MRAATIFILCACLAGGTVAFGAHHESGSAATPRPLVESYSSLADTILGAKNAEWNLVHAILATTYGHAEATAAAVKLSVSGDRLQFEVRDDGRGFDVNVAGTGSGLAGMADRLDTVGGEVRIESTPGAGTVVTGSVPIRELVSS